MTSGSLGDKILKYAIPLALTGVLQIYPISLGITAIAILIMILIMKPSKKLL